MNLLVGLRLLRRGRLQCLVQGPRAPRSNGLCGTVHDHAVLDQPLQQPVTLSVASNAGVDTLGAQIKVAVVADAAVVVLARNGISAVIAVDAEDRIGRLEKQRIGLLTPERGEGSRPRRNSQGVVC